ncbi:MAG TPA: hypothetical protein HA258_07000, partial [Thermoplasmata archaeon]|nr:hypothetical protein [Thermoplasmata archaeon]
SIDPLEKEILFRTSFSVRNQGAYDIRDIDISAQLVNKDKTPLVSYEKQGLVVLRGTNTTFDLLIPIDLDTISFFDWFSLIYKNTTLQLLLDIDALYMFGLVEFTANEAIDIPWTQPPLNLSDNRTIQAGIQGICTLFNITENKSITTISDIFSLLSLPEIYFSSGNGFVFNLTITAYSESVKNISCQIITPLLIIDGAVEFTVSFLVGFEGNTPVFRIQEVGIEYVT